MREEALSLLLEFFVFRSDNESCRTKRRYVVAVSLRDSYSQKLRLWLMQTKVFETSRL
jgi:hypothetical protein